jgi:hypothetical protein
MSRNTKSSWVVLPLTTIVAMVLTLLGSITAPASAVASDPIIPPTPSCTVTLVSGDPVTAPPAPTCYDPSGSDLDEFLVPLYYDGAGLEVLYVDTNQNRYWSDRPNSTMGASQVSVRSKQYIPSSGMYGITHSWFLGFNTAVTVPAGLNNYWVSVGQCITSAGITVREATAFITNEPGADGRYIGYVYPRAGTTGADALDTEPAFRVYDGSTRAIPLVTEKNNQRGLRPGKIWTVTFFLEDRSSVDGSGAGTRRVGAEVQVDVPSCGSGSGEPPETDPSAVKPQAKIIVLKRGPVYSKVKVVLGSRKATQPTRYRVIRDPRRGPTLRKTYLTKYKAVTYYKVKRGTVVNVRSKTVLAKRRV